MFEILKNTLRLPATLLAIGVAVFIALSSNMALWQVIAGLPVDKNTAWLMKSVVFLLVTLVLSVLMLLLPGRAFIKPVAIILLFLTAIIGYFQAEMGVTFHPEMIRNIVNNIQDQNTNEALELISLPLLQHLLWFFLLPAAIVALLPVSRQGIIRESIERFAGVATLAALLGVLFITNQQIIMDSGREYRNLRSYVNPVYPVGSLIKLYRMESRADNMQFTELGTDAKIDKHPGRTVGIIVVGETARADHFSLNGYQRQTNPLLEKQKLVNFSDTTACGTSTIYSVPCMFSLLTSEQYTPEQAGHQSNVLDVLQNAGVKILWIDNNSTCKGVCERVETLNYREYPDPSMPYYGHGEYFDEVLLYQLEEKIRNTDKDMLIVLHMLGSHGPAYYKRVPDQFKKFTPECEENTYQQCRNNQEFVNEYDNSIVYTDFFLNKTIEFLKKLDPQYNTFMLYASDHGESLGEDGMYLHGAPIEAAPDAQLKVPYLAWLSETYLANHNLDQQVLVEHAVKPTSHDSISHTLLGLLDVESAVYDRALDVFVSE
jgi:lipid A ethanolaminephosphotransferase